MNRFAALILSLLLVGCASMESVPQRLAMLHEGMTQQEVTRLLGKPRTITNQGALRVFDYTFAQEHPAVLHADQPPVTSYYVVVGRDGLVRSFGPN